MSPAAARTGDDLLVGAPVTTRGHSLPVALELGRLDAVRLTRHPLVLVALAWVALGTALSGDYGPRSVYTLVTDLPTFLLGPFVFFAANLLATRERRRGNEEWLDSMPASPTQRTVAAQVAVLGPVVLVTGLVLVALAVALSTDRFVIRPPALEVAGGLLPILGAGLLGVMVARWLPRPGTAAVVMVGLVAVHGWLNDSAHELLGAYVEWAAWSASGNAGAWAGVVPGSRGWHAVYLLSLCAMAATGTHLRQVRRKVPLLAMGAACTAAAAVAGWAQLP